MKRTLMDEGLIDYGTNGLFFGKRNIARLDIGTNDQVNKLYKTLQGQLWFPSDFSISDDSPRYAVLPKNRKIDYLKNLKFQTMVDSLATRAIVECFLPVTSDPELENWWVLHSFTESIHSLSYADIIKALPVDAQKEFDDIIVNDNIMGRAENIIYHLDNLMNEKTKENLLMALYALVVMEGALFQSSFVVSYSFAEEFGMTETAKVIQRIDLDENMHLTMGKYLIKTLLKEEEYREIYERRLDDILEMFKVAMVTDEEWSEYCLPEPMKTINSTTLKMYVRYNIAELMKYLKLPSILPNDLENPLTFISKYKNTKNLQISLNETSGTNYLLGKINNELNTNELLKAINGSN